MKVIVETTKGTFSVSYHSYEIVADRGEYVRIVGPGYDTVALIPSHHLVSMVMVEKE